MTRPLPDSLRREVVEVLTTFANLLEQVAFRDHTDDARVSCMVYVSDMHKAKAALAALSAGGEPQPVIGHLHSNGDFCCERMPEAVTSWPVSLYAAPPPASAPTAQTPGAAMKLVPVEPTPETNATASVFGLSQAGPTDEQINRAFALAYPPDVTSIQDRRIIARALAATHQGQAQAAPTTHHPEYVKGWNAARRLFGPQAAPAEQLAAALGWPGGISDPEQDWPTLLREVARRDPWQRAEQRLADAGHVAGEPTDDATKEQARDAVKRMRKARNFPAGTDACSRHVALMAETLAQGQPYPMLDEEREHCATSLAITVAMLWEARAALSHQAGQKEGA